MQVLVIQAARLDTLRQYLVSIPDGARITVLRSRPRPGAEREDLAGPASPVAWIDAPPGPLSWRRLDAKAREAARAQRWAEIVVLHNLGDDSYADVLQLALRAGPLAPLRVYYADGEHTRHWTVLGFLARRWSRAFVALLLVAAVAPLVLTIALRRKAEPFSGSGPP